MYSADHFERLTQSTHNTAVISNMLIVHGNAIAAMENVLADARAKADEAKDRHEQRMTVLTVAAYSAKSIPDPKTGELRAPANADERKAALQRAQEEDRILRARARKMAKANEDKDHAQAALDAEVTLFTAWKEIARLRTAELNRSAARQE